MVILSNIKSKVLVESTLINFLPMERFQRIVRIPFRKSKKGQRKPMIEKREGNKAKKDSH